MRSGRAIFLGLGLLLAGTAFVPAGQAEESAPSLSAIEKMRDAGDVAGAAKCAMALIAQHPEDLDAHLTYQDLQLSLGHEKEVLDTYRTAARAADASADAHYLYARLLRGPAAISEFRAAVKADPRHFWALCGLGIELTHAKSLGEAKSALDDAAKLRPDSAVPLNALGRLEEARGRNADAEKLYRAALDIDPAMTIARVNLGLLLVGAGRQDEAVKTLQDAAARAPKDPMPLLGLGMAYMSAKDATSAVGAYKRAVEIDAGNITSLNLLANAYMTLDQLPLADEALQQALKKAPDSVTTKIDLAYLRIAQNQLDEAMKFALAATQLDDSSAEAHYLVGLVFDHQSNPHKAEIEFVHASKLDDDNPLYVRAIAALAASQADWKTAIAEYQKVVKMTNASSDSLMALAGAYVSADKAKLAAATYEQVLAAEPARLDAWLQLGIVSQRDLRDTKKASKAFHEYVKRGGTDPRVAGWLAVLDDK